MVHSRRAWFSVVAALAGGFWHPVQAWQGGLDQFGGATPDCAPNRDLTPALPADGTFRAGSPERTSLVEAGAPGQRFVLSGTVSGVTCGRIKGATVDVWQPDPSGRYDNTGYRYRGHVVTDAEGKYRIVTVVPGAPSGRAKHISLRVTVPGKLEFSTEAFFPDDSQNTRDARFKPELLIKKTVDGGTFDISLNL